MNPILLILGLGIGGYALYKKFGEGPSALDATTAHTTSTPGTVPVQVTVPGPDGKPTSTVVNVPTTPPGTPPTGAPRMPMPQPPPPQKTPDAAPPIATLPTATEPSQTLRVVNPSKQPKVPTPENEQKARAAAPGLRDALVANPKGAAYAQLDAASHINPAASNMALVALVSAFQSAVGLFPDGLYGPQTAGALAYYLGSNPPPPFFYGTGERTIKTYLPTP